MKRRTVILLAASLLLTAGCRRNDTVQLHPTNENEPVLGSTVHAADPNTALQLVEGFNQVEQNSWRWTKGKFSFTLKTPANAAKNGGKLSLKFALPDAILSKVKTTTLTAKVSQVEVGSSTYSAAGSYIFVADVPPALLGTEAVTAEFALSKFLPAGAGDARELGIVFTSVSLESK